MTDTDFSQCKFIEEEMRFITFTDFYKQRFGIKRLYSSLPNNARIFYRWYVYANTHMKSNYKNIIWDYLNDFAEEVDLLYYIQNYQVF